jgi:hypothetical protein
MECKWMFGNRLYTADDFDVIVILLSTVTHSDSDVGGTSRLISRIGARESASLSPGNRSFITGFESTKGF